MTIVVIGALRVNVPFRVTKLICWALSGFQIQQSVFIPLSFKEDILKWILKYCFV